MWILWRGGRGLREGWLIIYMLTPTSPNRIDMSNSEINEEDRVVAGIIGGGLLGGAVGGAAGAVVGAFIGAIATGYVNQQSRRP